MHWVGRCLQMLTELLMNSCFSPHGLVMMRSCENKTWYDDEILQLLNESAQCSKDLGK
jgi:hypothetical protein